MGLPTIYPSILVASILLTEPKEEAPIPYSTLKKLTEPLVTFISDVCHVNIAPDRTIFLSYVPNITIAFYNETPKVVKQGSEQIKMHATASYYSLYTPIQRYLYLQNMQH